MRLMDTLVFKVRHTGTYVKYTYIVTLNEHHIFQRVFVVMRDCTLVFLHGAPAL